MAYVAPMIGSSVDTGIGGPPPGGQQSQAPSSQGGVGGSAVGNIFGGIGAIMGSAGITSNPTAGLTSPYGNINSSMAFGNSPATAATIQQIQNAQRQGGMLGNIRQGVGYASLGNSLAMKAGGGSAALGAGLGTASGLLGLYSGIKQGGVQGYGSAAVGALKAGSGIASLAGNSALAGTLGAAAGYVAAPLAVYSAIKNWQSGNTAGDAIQGAEAGAAIGSIVPGIGNIIGGVIGGVVGAVSSAFGGGETSKEAQSDWHIDTAMNSASPAQRQAAMSQMSPSQSTQYINGLMNAHDNSPGHSEQIEQVFGKNGVNNLMTQMTTNINAAIAKNPQLQFASPSTLYSSVVTPWLKSKGVTISPSSVDKNGNNEGAGLGDAITNMIGDWQSGSWTSSTPVGVAGQTINIPAYSQAGTVQMEQNMLTQMAGMI